MLLFIFSLSIFLIPYFFYRKFLISIIITYELEFQNMLSTKKFSIFNVQFYLNNVYKIIKLKVMFYAIWFFLSVTHMFFNDFCKLNSSQVFVGLIVFVLPYLTFVFLISKICINAFQRKFVYINEILDIFIFSYAIGILSLFMEEYGFYPGKLIKEKTFI